MSEWEGVSWVVAAAAASLMFLGIVADDLCASVRTVERAEAAVKRAQREQDETRVEEGADGEFVADAIIPAARG